MNVASRCLLVLLLAGTAAYGFTASQEMQPPKSAPRVDALGDPLPPGALMRLGTARFQLPHLWSVGYGGGDSPYLPRSVAGGKAYLVFLPKVEDKPDHFGECRWFDAVTGKTLDTWLVPKGHLPVGTSPDGRWALFSFGGKQGQRDFSLRLFDLATRRETQRFTGKHQDEFIPNTVRCCFSSDGRWIATTEQAQGIDLLAVPAARLWDVKAGTQIWLDRDTEYGFEAIGFTPDNSRFVLYIHSTDTIKVIDPVQRKVVKHFPLGERVWARCLAPDGKSLLCRGDAEITIWDIETGKQTAGLKRNSADAMAFTPDGRALVTEGAQNEKAAIVVRDWPSCAVRQIIKTDIPAWQGIAHLSVSADGRIVNLVFRDQYRLCRYDLRTGKALPLPAMSHAFHVLGVRIGKDGTVFSLGEHDEVLAWDLGSAKGRPIVQTGSVWPVVVSPNGKRAIVQDRGPIRLIDHDTGESLRPIRVDSYRAEYVFTPDSRLLASFCFAHEVGRVRIWDAATGVLEAAVHCQALYTSTFSPDSEQLLLATGRGVEFWRVKDWKQSKLLPVSTNRLIFSPEGRTLLCLNDNDREPITLVELATNQIRAKYESPWRLGLTSLSPDGKHLAGLGPGNCIVLWDIYQGKQVAVFEGQDRHLARTGLEIPIALAFTRDGKQLISGSYDGTLLVWDVAGAVAKQPAAARLSVKEIQGTWSDLATSDAATAFSAVRALVNRPEQAIDVIGKRLVPADPFDGSKIPPALADLDSPAFAKRQQAFQQLAGLDDRAEKLLRDFLAGQPPLEAKRRAESALASITQRRLQALRALEVLEVVGTDAARAELRRLADGAADATLTREAQAALGRLKGR